MPIRWDLLQPGNAGAAFQSGFENGQRVRQQRQVQGALSALAVNPNDRGALGALQASAPELAFKMEDRLREQRSRSALSRVFGGGAASPPAIDGASQGALSTAYGQPRGPVSLTGSAPGMPSAAMSGGVDAPVMGATPAAPGVLLDPSRLPPRTDGLGIDHAALRQLYAEDPKTAFEVQKMVYDADAASFKRMQASGGVMAQAAYQLSTIKNPDGSADMAGRQRELEAMAPQLVGLGLQPESLARADLSDTGLSRYLRLGRSINDLVRDDRADRQLDWNMEDDRIDNARADRSESRQEHYRARSDARAERQDGRSAVRFRERDKDRAALAGLAGIRTDLSDLDY